MQRTVRLQKVEQLSTRRPVIDMCATHIYFEQKSIKSVENMELLLLPRIRHSRIRRPIGAPWPVPAGTEAAKNEEVCRT